MALVLNDRVKETTTTTGTGTVNLGGAATGFETFVAGIGTTNKTFYAIELPGNAEFEVGIGTVTDASPDTLSRDTIISSSNSDSAVDFSAGTKNVFCTLPASKAVVEDANNNITTPNGDNGLGLGTDTVPHGGVGAAKLAIEGSDSNFGAGPHVQFTTTSDDHPLMQILPYAHDNVAISFDAYHNGTNWISSDAGSNFQIYKLSDSLNFYYKSGVAAGSTAAPWNSGAYLSATSVYGDHKGDWVNENSITKPSSPNGKSRLQAENSWISLSNKKKFPLQIFRLAGIYSNEFNILKRLQAGTVQIVDKKNHFFSRIHVEDIGNILFKSINNFKNNEIYNINLT